jgi:hypothetical protein
MTPLARDEADLWAPERIVDKEGEAAKLHSVMQTVVRRGRVKGLTSWLISQRPAALSKAVLSQVDGLVAFRLTASSASCHFWLVNLPFIKRPSHIGSSVCTRSRQRRRPRRRICDVQCCALSSQFCETAFV